MLKLLGWSSLLSLIVVAVFAPGARAAPAAAEAGDGASMLTEDDSGLLGDIQRENEIRRGQIKQQVEREVKDAQSRMGENPDGVKQSLKMMLDQISRAPELTTEDRFEMQKQLKTLLQEAGRRQVEKDARDQQTQSVLANAKERQRLSVALDTEQEKVKQLMDRFNSLMDERRYLEAEESVASEVQALAPNSTVGIEAALMSRMTRYVQTNVDLRVRRQKGVVDTLLQS